MARALDQDLLDRVIDAVLKEGMSRRGAAERFGVSPSTAVKWLQAVSREKRYRPVGTGGHRPSALPAVRDWLLSRIEEQPDITCLNFATNSKNPGGSGRCPQCYPTSSKKSASALKKSVRQRAGST